MTDQLPERIWACPESEYGHESLRLKTWDDVQLYRDGYETEYLRADAAIPKAEADAMVAAEKERITEMLVDLVSKPMPGRMGKSGVPWIGWTDEEYKSYLLGWNNYRDMVRDLLISIREEKK